MCLAIPGRILKIEGTRAAVDVMGATSEISTALLQSVEVGDYVIVHAGCAIAVVDQQEAEETLSLFKELKELGHDEK